MIVTEFIFLFLLSWLFIAVKGKAKLFSGAVLVLACVGVFWHLHQIGFFH